MEPWRVEDVAKAADGRLLCGDGAVEITSVQFNSKEVTAGALFVPVIGERVDAHRFIGAAFQAGAAASFTAREPDALSGIQNGGALILVRDTVQALQTFAAACRSRFHIPVVGITGSVGKTTTKEMVAAALGSKMNVLKTAGNMNSQIGLPVMMTRLERSHEAAVIEMGMSEKDEMGKLAAIARPDIAIITNIGVSHIGQLGSKENILAEKLDIIKEFHENGILLLNGDDPMLWELAAEKTVEKLRRIRIYTYGTDIRCDYRAADIQTNGEETRFTFEGGGETVRVRLSVPGRHNVGNALAALAAAQQLGISASEAAQGLYRYQPIAMRGQIHEKDGYRIIDDTYNASPDSMKSGIHVLLSLDRCEDRIAVLADIRELGEKSRKYHYEVGHYIAKTTENGKQVDEVVTVGEEAKAITEAVELENPSIRTCSFQTNAEAAEYLAKRVHSGTAVLIKGSRSMHTDEIAAALLE